MVNLWRLPILSAAIFAAWKWDARRKYKWTKSWISPEDRWLDIGSGPGSFLSVSRENGHNVQGLDVRPVHYRDELRAHIYDGVVMPYEDKSYEGAFLLTMLHHTPDPELILHEAARTARRLIIIEDVYDNRLGEIYTKLTDKVTNLEFRGHPHTNRTDAEWKDTFARLGFELIYAKTHRLALIYQQAVYVVDTPPLNQKRGNG